MLTERLEEMRNFAQKRMYKQYRTFIGTDHMRILKKLNYNLTQRNAYILGIMCRTEDPIVFKDCKCMEVIVEELSEIKITDEAKEIFFEKTNRFRQIIKGISLLENLAATNGLNKIDVKQVKGLNIEK